MAKQHRFRRGWSGPWVAAIAILATCLGGLGAAVSFAQMDQGRAVIVVTTDVVRGSIIQPSDLGLAEIQGDQATGIPFSEKDSVIGQRALTDLVAGSLLAPGSYGQLVVADGLTQVQLRLDPSQLPSGGLPGGQNLVLIGLPDGEDDARLMVGARVLYPPREQVDGTYLIDVTVASGEVAWLAPFILGHRVVVVAVG